MTTSYVGELSLGAVIPLPVSLVAIAQAQVQAQLTATIAASVQLGIPSTILDLLNLAQSILSSLEQMLALGLEPPSLSLQVTIFASVIALLEAQLAPYLAFGALMAAAGVFVYVYDGATNGAGAELTTALSAGFPGHGATDHCNLLVLGTVDAVTWGAMQQVFRTA